MITSIEEIFKHLNHNKKLPIIFTGSGFSKRYTTNDYKWDELLIKCIEFYSDNPKNKYKYYEEEVKYQLRDSTNYFSLNEKIGSMVARDFNKHFYSMDDTPFEITEEQTPIKVYIANLLNDYSIKEEMKHELDLLTKLRRKMLTVVTTNYDSFIEDIIFPDHDKVISQRVMEANELGALYKIHGCVSDPESIILTEQDYMRFNKKRKVLSAKLISLFVSHPVIFMGYSISDKNIREILFDIYSSLDDPSDIDFFENRLIFVDYDEHEINPKISQITIEEDNVQVNMIKISTNSYVEILKHLSALERTISIRDLQLMKDMVYDIVEDFSGEQAKVMNLIKSSQQSEDKIIVAITTMDRIQGLMQDLPDIDTIMHDVVFDDLEGYEAEWIIRNLAPILRVTNITIPVNKYLSESELRVSEFDEWIQDLHKRDVDHYVTESIKKYAVGKIDVGQLTYKDLLDVDRKDSGKMNLLVRKAADETNYLLLEEFLKEYYDELYKLLPGKTLFRKLIYILDIKKYKTTVNEGVIDKQLHLT